MKSLFITMDHHFSIDYLDQEPRLYVSSTILALQDLDWQLYPNPAESNWQFMSRKWSIA